MPRASRACCAAAERGSAAGELSACSREGVVADEDEAEVERAGAGRREYEDILEWE